MKLIILLRYILSALFSSSCDLSMLKLFILLFPLSTVGVEEISTLGLGTRKLFALQSSEGENEKDVTDPCWTRGKNPTLLT